MAVIVHTAFAPSADARPPLPRVSDPDWPSLGERLIIPLGKSAAGETLKHDAAPQLPALGTGTILWPFASSAQQKVMPSIGFLGVGSLGGFAGEVAAFQQGLKDGGWTAGENVALEYRWAEGHFDRLASLADELVERRVAVIATSGGVLAARAAKNAT